MVGGWWLEEDGTGAAVEGDEGSEAMVRFGRDGLGKYFFVFFFFSGLYPNDIFGLDNLGAKISGNYPRRTKNI